MRKGDENVIHKQECCSNGGPNCFCLRPRLNPHQNLKLRLKLDHKVMQINGY